MLDAQATIQIARTVETVFEVADDFAQAPAWLEACAELKQVSDGPRATGTLLHYTYDQGGRRGEMDGVLLVYEKGRRLEMKYSDRMFEVTVALQIALADSGSLVTHTVSIAPKTFFARLMSPMIRAGNRRQVVNNVRHLKELAEKAA